MKNWTLGCNVDFHPRKATTMGIIKSSVTTKFREVVLPLYSSAVRIGILYPALGLPTKEGHRLTGVGQEEDHKSIWEARITWLWRKAERTGVLQPREKEVLRRAHWRLTEALQYLKDTCKKRRKNFFYLYSQNEDEFL